MTREFEYTRSVWTRRGEFTRSLSREEVSILEVYHERGEYTRSV